MALPPCLCYARRVTPPRPDLASLRHARGFSQADVARDLKTAQADVSKLERRGDPRLSTLIRYVAALGGELELVARFGSERLPVVYSVSPRKGRR